MSDHEQEPQLVPYPTRSRGVGGSTGTIGDYWRFLQDDPRASAEEPDHVVYSFCSDAFFSDPEHFAFLGERILPVLAARRRSAGWRTCNLWCVGCGTGEEAYSLALAAEAALAPLDPVWPWRIEASEPSPRALQRARIGVYAEKALERIPPAMRSVGFERGFGPQSGRVRVRSRLQENITFRDLTGTEETLPFRDPFHVILCRSALNAWPAESRAASVHRLLTQLVPGGYLIVGRSDPLDGDLPTAHRVAPHVYRRPL
jgi:chemotaxis protein methyltransferase CheR